MAGLDNLLEVARDLAAILDVVMAIYHARKSVTQKRPKRARGPSVPRVMAEPLRRLVKIANGLFAFGWLALASSLFLLVAIFVGEYSGAFSAGFQYAWWTLVVVVLTLIAALLIWLGWKVSGVDPEIGEARRQMFAWMGAEPTVSRKASILLGSAPPPEEGETKDERQPP
jgi:hypothetical protein